MTKDDIIKLARQAGWRESFTPPVALYRFAALVRAAEREACEKIQFELRERYISQNKTAQAEIMLLTAVYDYAAAIRARGQDPMPLFDDWPGGWKK